MKKCGFILSVKIKSFKYRKDTTDVLQGIDFAIKKSSINVILGDSGSGKSTLLQVLSGIIPFFNHGYLDGNILYKNSPITNHSIKSYIANSAYLSQNPEQNILFNTVEDELIYNLENKKYSQSKIKHILEKFLNYFDLNNILKARVEALSQGQKQLVALVASLITTPDIVFLDEPTSMLDFANTKIFCNAIQKIMTMYPDMSFIVSTHKKDLSKAISTNEFQMNNGQIAMLGTNTPNFKYTIRGNRRLLNCETKKYVFNNSEPLLKVKNLDYCYQKNKCVLKRINFKVNKGETIWISGPNAGGKSTLILLVAGLIKNKSGKIFFKSRQIISYKHLLPKHIGFVMQNPDHQIMCSSINEELALTLESLNFSSDECTNIVQEGISRLHRLTNMSTQDPREASFGQKKMITILSFLNYPDLLILDEPDLALDHKNIEIMVELLNKFRAKGSSIIIVSHNYSLMSRLSDRLIFLDKEILFDGPPSEFMQNRNY